MLQKFNLQTSATPLLFINYSLIEVMYLLIRLSRTCPSYETQRILIKIVQNTHNTERE